MSGISGAVNGQTVTVKELIEGFLNIDYCENEDGMMGIFRNLPNSRLIFIIATVVILAGIFVYLLVSKNNMLVHWWRIWFLRLRKKD